MEFHIILLEVETCLLINSICFAFSVGLTCHMQLQPPMIISVSTFVHMCLWPTFLENEVWDCSQTQQEYKGMIVLGTNLMWCPKELKRKRGRLYDYSKPFLFNFFFPSRRLANLVKFFGSKCIFWPFLGN